MKILYIVPSLSLPSDLGVARKISDQVSAWKELGAEVVALAICNTAAVESLPPLITPLSSRTGIGRQLSLLRILVAWFRLKPDVVYLRYFFLKPATLLLALVSRVVVEVNTRDTVEMKALFPSGLRGRLRAFQNGVTREILFRLCVGIVFVTHELSCFPEFRKFGKRSEVVPNSVNLERFAATRAAHARRQAHEDTGRPRRSLVFVGSPGLSWHGLGTIKAIARSLAHFADLHIVGETGTDEANIFFHGVMESDAVVAFLAGMDIGVGTFNLAAKGMREACPLKTREYLGSGLPVVIGYDDTAFLERRPDWIFQMDPKDVASAESLEALERFCRDHGTASLSHGEIARFIDFRSVESGRLEFLSRVAGRNDLAVRSGSRTH